MYNILDKFIHSRLKVTAAAYSSLASRHCWSDFTAIRSHDVDLPFTVELTENGCATSSSVSSQMGERGHRLTGRRPHPLVVHGSRAA